MGNCLPCLPSQPAPLKDAPVRERTTSGDVNEMVEFLFTVPLFQTQLSKAELPKLAQRMRRQTWKPGEEVTRQGEKGHSFYVIEEGEAGVTFTSGDDGVERPMLIAGDHFGGHTLSVGGFNTSGIVARGSRDLVCYTLSGKDFKEFGLHERFKFTKRTAFTIGGLSRASTNQSLARAGTFAQIHDEEVDFICRVVKRNANIRAMCDLETTADNVKNMAMKATKRKIAAGDVIAEYGSLVHEFFVVKSGSFELLSQERNAESSMAKRCERERKFMSMLHRSNDPNQTPGSSPSHQKGTKKQCGSVKRAPSKDIKKMASGSLATAMYPEAGSVRRGTVKATIDTDREFIPEGFRTTKAEMVEAAKLNFLCSEAPFPVSSPTGLSSQSVARAMYPGIAKKQAERRFLRAEDLFGELSLIYNCRYYFTVRALEPSEVYVISGNEFTSVFFPQAKRVQEYSKLLDEVGILESLVRVERKELARHARGLVKFEHGERILTQGKKREEWLWYVVESGSCMVSWDGKEVGTLRRAGHFGERSLLRGAATAEITVCAGEEGLVCLVIDGAYITNILKPHLRHLNLDMDVSDWLQVKFEGCWGMRNVIQRPRVTNYRFEDLEIEAVLGKGSFGDVFLTKEKTTGKQYALKRLSKGHVMSMGCVEQVCLERDILTMVDSPFIIHLHQTFKDKQYVYLFSEAALGGTLDSFLDEQPEFFTTDDPQSTKTAFYVACILSALEHLHERKIVYRDLKPDNIVLDSEGYAKLCDMGLSRFIVGKTCTVCGTADYMAPEVIDQYPVGENQDGYDHLCDWWALGCFTYELFTGGFMPWFDEGKQAGSLDRLLAIRRSQSKGIAFVDWDYPCSELAKDFVQQLLTPANCRLGSLRDGADLRAHLWFQTIRFDFDALHKRTLASPCKPQTFNPSSSKYSIHEPGVFRPYMSDGIDWYKDF